MKKKLLFVIPSLDAGGAEKSLITLLNTIDYSLYEVDLLVFHKKGLFLSLVPQSVSILTLEGDYVDFSKPLVRSIISFIKKGKLNLVINRLLFFFKNKIESNVSKAEQNTWRYIKSSIPISPQTYDVAIGALEKTSIYFAIEKVRSTKTIGWIHTNYSKSGMQRSFDLDFFKKLDFLVTVSEECSADLHTVFPEIQSKIKCIYNLVSPDLINELAQHPLTDAAYEHAQFTILTVARLSKEKGIELAVETSLALLKLGLDFKWYVIGDGQERNRIEQIIKENKLENVFVLLGLKENPYSYIKAATCYVQPSIYEGKSIAIDEAKILGKPIVITNFPTAKDQIQHEHNGLISEMNSIALANMIFNLLNDVQLQQHLIVNLNKSEYGTLSEIEKFYQLLND